MIYVIVQKNNNGDYVVTKTLSSTTSVRGIVTGITWNDITTITLEQRLTDCIWTQIDQYNESGEYMTFKNKETVFDPVAGTVTNTFNFELMPLDTIKTDIKTRVDSKRDSLRFSTFTFESNEYSIDATARGNFQLLAVVILFDETSFPVDYKVDLPDGTVSTFDIVKFKNFMAALSNYTYNLYEEARTIKNNIDAATTYEDIRAAASWDGVPL